MKRDLQHQGYSKAIDIWSIGCISATLLTNDMIFPAETDEYAANPATPSAQESSQRWNLSIMDTGHAWRSIGRKAKSFVRGCLVLEEDQRLTAKEALDHAWFTNRYYAADIEAAYQRAIQDWTPRRKSGDLIEFVNTTDVVPPSSRPGHIEQPTEAVKSHHFQGTALPAPATTFFVKMPAYVQHRKRVRTPLPAIDEDAECDVVKVPRSPGLTQDSSVLQSPIAVFASTQALTQETQEVGIEDFATPIDLRLLETQDEASVSQSQFMLDELSLLRPPPADGHLHRDQRMSR